MDSIFLDNLKEHMAVFSQLGALDERVMTASHLVAKTLRRGGKLMLCGNGGSASDGQHIAAEFTGRFRESREPLAAIALCGDLSAVTCIGNDYGFNEVFSRQVLALGKEGDCLIAISTSGKSENVIRAVLAARSRGISTIGLLGRGGGRQAELCDQSIIVPHNSTARIQEAHILIGHTICSVVEIEMGVATLPKIDLLE